MNFSFGLSIGCQKVLMHPNLHCKKHWLVQETNGFYKGSKFASSLVYRVVVKTSGRTSEPNSKWSIPRGIPSFIKFLNEFKTTLILVFMNNGIYFTETSQLQITGGFPSFINLLNEFKYTGWVKKKKKTAIIGWELNFKNNTILKKCPFLSRSWIYLYNGERMGMIEKRLSRDMLINRMA